MNDNLVYRFLGIVMISVGILICIDPIHYSHKFNRTFDFTGFNIPLGLAHIALGLGFVWSTFRKN